MTELNVPGSRLNDGVCFIVRLRPEVQHTSQGIPSAYTETGEITNPGEVSLYLRLIHMYLV